MLKCKTPMTEDLGEGIVKILLIVNEVDFQNWLDFFKKIIGDFPMLSVCISVNSNLGTFKNLVGVKDVRIPIFVLDVSSNGQEIKGYGDRYLGIVEKSGLGNLSIRESDSEVARWFSENYEFSTLEIGREKEDIKLLTMKIFDYFNGC